MTGIFSNEKLIAPLLMSTPDRLLEDLSPSRLIFLNKFRSIMAPKSSDENNIFSKLKKITHGFNKSFFNKKEYNDEQIIVILENLESFLSRPLIRDELLGILNEIEFNQFPKNGYLFNILLFQENLPLPLLKKISSQVFELVGLNFELKDFYKNSELDVILKILRKNSVDSEDILIHNSAFKSFENSNEEMREKIIRFISIYLYTDTVNSIYNSNLVEFPQWLNEMIDQSIVHIESLDSSMNSDIWSLVSVSKRWTKIQRNAISKFGFKKIFSIYSYKILSRLTENLSIFDKYELSQLFKQLIQKENKFITENDRKKVLADFEKNLLTKIDPFDGIVILFQFVIEHVNSSNPNNEIYKNIIHLLNELEFRISDEQSFLIFERLNRSFNIKELEEVKRSLFTSTSRYSIQKIKKFINLSIEEPSVFNKVSKTVNCGSLFIGWKN